MAELLQGDAGVIGLYSVIQLAESEALTGRIVLPRGGVWLHLGSVVGARFDDQVGVHALYEHLLWRGGRFSVQAAAVDPAPPLGPTGALMLEGCRLLDEWMRLQGMVLAHAPGGAVDGLLAALLPHLDGRRTVREVVDRAGMLRCRAVDALLRGLQDALLVQRAVAKEALPDSVVLPDAPEDDDADALVERGRRLLREGRLEAARASLERAVALRPHDRVVTQNLRRIAALQGS